MTWFRGMLWIERSTVGGSGLGVAAGVDSAQEGSTVRSLPLLESGGDELHAAAEINRAIEAATITVHGRRTATVQPGLGEKARSNDFVLMKHVAARRATASRGLDVRCKG